MHDPRERIRRNRKNKESKKGTKIKEFNAEEDNGDDNKAKKKINEQEEKR